MMSIDPRTLASRQVLCRSCICGADFADPCAECSKGRWWPVKNCLAPLPARPLPSLTTMAGTAAAAAIAETKAIIAGVPAVTDEEVAARLAICQACDDYLADSNRCSRCGCFLKFKTALRTGQCPVGKW